MDDLISRQAAIDALDGLPNCPNGYSDTYDKACIIGVLEELPSAQPERKTGKWGEAHRRGVLTYADIYAECSACHSEPVFNGWEMRYCPNCGAKMEEEK